MTLLKLRAGDVQAYRGCDLISEWIILFQVVFTPWAFGTTQPWSIWTMNAAGFALGWLLLTKLAIRWLKGYRPPRWEPEARGDGNGSSGRHGQALITMLAWITAALVGWCFISAVNARATWRPAQLSFEYHHYLAWLPHSYDSGKSWPAFWMYLGMAWSFWAIRDWVLGKSDAETARTSVADLPAGVDRAGEVAWPVPERLRRLLWLLALNGGLLAIEGIVQRFEGSGRLLFLLQPRVNPEAVTQFGPWAYRSNAAQYFNLLWPVCAGFWWTLQRTPDRRRCRHHWLLVCVALMAACPIISSSRGGAMITVGIAALAAIGLLLTQLLSRDREPEAKRASARNLAVLVMCFATALVLGFGLGWKNLAPRMEGVRDGFAGREEMYERARPMVADYPWLGTGPGTFETVFQLYRRTLDTYWPAQLHNDWLETRITFGLLGSGLIWAGLGVVLVRWFFPGGIHGGRRFVLLVWVAMAGCLIHARFDLPFQIPSIVSLFLVLCAITTVLSRR